MYDSIMYTNLLGCAAPVKYERRHHFDVSLLENIMCSTACFKLVPFILLVDLFSTLTKIIVSRQSDAICSNLVNQTNAFHCFIKH